MKRGFHDLSVLFDDDGKKYFSRGYRDIRIPQLNDALDDIIPGTEHLHSAGSPSWAKMHTS